MNRDRINEWSKQVYKDLADKHMLIPAIVLVVAIIAVPLLLGGGGSDATSTTSVPPAVETVPAAMTGSEEVDPVVLAEVPGLRDYRERLDQFDARNPFEQQMTGGSGKGASTESAGTGSGGSGSSSTASSSTSSSSSSVSTDTGSTPTAPITPPDTGGDTGGGGEVKFFQINLDVKVGPPGKAKILEGVEPLDFLPGGKTPVVQYVQGDIAATKAAFVVSPSVVTSDGDGNCDPGRNDCQFLLMRKGDEQTFEYGDKLKPYKLKVIDITRVEVKAKDAKELGKDARKTADAAAQFVASMDK